MSLSDIPESEQNPTVFQLLEIIKSQSAEIVKLKEEIARLKNRPTKPKLRPSKISESEKKTSSKKQKSKSSKTKKMEIHNVVTLHPENLPKRAKLIYYKDYFVQDIKIVPNNTKYRIAVYRLPDGSLEMAKRPPGAKSHFGSNLKADVLYLYYKANMTQPSILDFLTEHGIQISAAQISRILTQGHEAFHKEKEEILRRGMEVSQYIVADDTGHRHKGKNGYCTHLGNQFFAYFKSSYSKNRLNFLQMLCVSGNFYHLNGFSYGYMKNHRFPESDLVRLKQCNGMKFSSEPDWLSFLKNQGINSDNHIKTATEGALIGFLSTSGLLNHLVFVSDEAGQFNVFSHALCWVHSERKLSDLIPENHEQRVLLEKTLNSFWEFYRRLKQYKEQISVKTRFELKKEYHKIFEPSTSWESLNKVLKSFQDNSKQLLMVLDRPAIPLTNNESERDIRSIVTKRKVSAGTRSDDGREARDTFASLIKTCLKSDIPFLKYLKDRIAKTNQIPCLTQIISEKALQFT